MRPEWKISPPAAWQTIRLDRVDSTSSFLKRNAADLPDRLAVRADAQTEGRGRMGRSWSSPRGGLYMSLLLRPAPPPEIAALVPLLMAHLLGIRFWDATGVPALVKWPNDCLVPDGKLAGILAEYGGRKTPWLVVGMGVNLDAAPEKADDRPIPPSAWSDYGAPPPAGDLFEGMLADLDGLWPLRGVNPLPGVRRSIERRLWSRGREVAADRGSDIVRGVVEGLDDLGHLRVYGPTGTTVLSSGEIRPTGLEEPKMILEGGN